MSKCATPEEMERVVGAGELTGEMKRHIAGCAACREQERLVRENLEFMRGFVGEVGETALANVGRSAPPAADVMPGYRLVREIARGGQGIVYEGTQTETKRRVAVKMIEPGEKGGRGRRRIEREAEIAAGLRHPNIVTVYDSAALPDGRYALAMEYIDGASIDEWARKVDVAAGEDREARREAVRVKLRAMVAVCDAVQYAHQNGVIHRDLKPANVLVGEEGVPRVVDFGIARRVKPDETLTRAGAFAGTLAYASPEQVSGGADSVDTRTDIYSLGLILYEVLTGRRPYATDGSLTGAIANITKTDPEAMGTVEPGGQPAGGELEAIVRRALAKEPGDRYQTAVALREDLENWLGGRAVEAKGESTLYVLRKTATRHKGAFVVAAGVVVLLAVFAVSMAWSARRLDHQRGLLAESLASSTIERGRLLGMNGANSRAEELIWPELVRSGADPADPGLGLESSPEATQAAWALFELYSRHPSLMHVSAMRGIEGIAFDEGGKRIRVARPNGAQEVWSVPEGQVVENRPAMFDPPPARVVFDKQLRRAVAFKGAELEMLDLATGKRRSVSDPQLGEVWWAEVNEAGNRVLTSAGQGAVLRLWQAEPFRQIAVLAEGVGQESRAHFSADGLFVAGGAGDEVRLWKSEDGAAAGVWKVPPQRWEQALHRPITFGQLSPDHRRLAAAINIWALVYSTDDPAAAPLQIEAHKGFVNHVDFSGDSQELLTTGYERSYATWNARTGEPIGSFERSEPRRGPPAMTDDGSLVALCDIDGGVQVFESRPRRWLTRLRGAENSVHCVRFSPDGSLVAASSADGSIRVWRCADRSQAWASSLPGPVSALSFSPDGKWLAGANEEGRICVWSASEGGTPRELAQWPVQITWIGYTRDGQALAAAGGSEVRLYDAATGKGAGSLEGHTSRVVEAAFSSDGTGLATASTDGTSIVWDLGARKERMRLKDHTASVRAVCYSPDGSLIATGSDDWSIKIWDARSGQCLKTLRNVKQHVFGLAFHPKGNLLFSCCRDSVVQVWDVRTGGEVALLEGHDGLVLSLALSPDGRTLATGSGDKTVGLWDLAYYQTHVRGNAAVWSKESGERQGAAADQRR